MTIVREATQHGVKGKIVRVEASERFVADHYSGKDPRTKAARKK